MIKKGSRKRTVEDGIAQVVAVVVLQVRVPGNPKIRLGELFLAEVETRIIGEEGVRQGNVSRIIVVL